MNYYLLSAIGTVALWLFYYAFKHPKAFNNRFVTLLLLTASISGCAFCWYLSASLHLEEILKFINKENSEAIKTSIETFNHNKNLAFMTGTAAIFYLNMLLFIHNILGIEKENK